MKILVILIFVLCSCKVFSGGDVTAEWVSASLYRPDDLSMAKQVRISNALTHYRLDFLLSKGNTFHGKEPKFIIAMREPSFYFAFSAPLWSFIFISVNEIGMSQLDFKESDLNIWKKDDIAGVDLKLNFDGVKMTLTFFLRNDSPVLWGTLQNESNQAVEKVNVGFKMVPSFVVNGKLNDVYEREAITANRSIEMSKKEISLTSEDKYLILTDKKYQPSTEPKSIGPCFFVFSSEDVSMLQLSMPNHYLTGLSVALTSNFKKFKFGLWESSRKWENKDFINYFQTHSDEFKFKE